jgi:hypothetical protein
MKLRAFKADVEQSSELKAGVRRRRGGDYPTPAVWGPGCGTCMGLGDANRPTFRISEAFAFPTCRGGWSVSHVCMNE